MAQSILHVRSLVAEPEQHHTARAQRFALSLFVHNLAYQTGKPVAALMFDDITSQRFLAFKAALSEGHKPATVAQRLNLVKRWTTTAAQKMGVGDPLADTRVRQVYHREYRAFSRDELLTIRETARAETGDKWVTSQRRFVVELLPWTGLRRTEARRIIPAQISADMTHFRDVWAKGGNVADVPIVPELGEELERYLSARHNFLGHLGQHLPLLPLSDSGLYRMVRQICDQAGVKGSPHNFRHTFGDLLFQHLSRKGLPYPEVVRLVMAALRHRHIRHTLRYTEPAPDHLRNSVTGLFDV